MKDMLWIIRNTLRMTFSKKKNIILFLFVPLIGIFISLMAYGNQGPRNIHVGIINHDDGKIAADMIHFLDQLDYVMVSQLSESEVEDQLISDQLDCVLTLEKGFSDSVIAGNPDHLIITSIKGAEITGFVKSYLYHYLDNITALSKVASGDKVIFNQMYENYQKKTFKLSTTTLQDTSKNKEMTYQTIGFLIMIMLFSAGNMSEIILNERENRTYYRLLASPISSKQYVFSNVVVNMIVMIAQILITLLVMTKVFHIAISMPYWQMASVLIMFAFIAVGLSLTITAFSASANAAGALQNLIVTPSSLLAGCFWPIEIMPTTAQKIAEFLPQRWVLTTITELQAGVQFASLTLNYLILLVFALAFFLIAIYKFGRNNSVRNYI